MEDISVISATSTIVAAYLASNGPVAAGELGGLIGLVRNALDGSALGMSPAQAPRGEPAVSVRKSVTPDYLVCLEDGKKVKMLKRHLRVLGMTPDEYRARWDLPGDYPMVAANYSEQRSALAKASGLGVKPAAHATAGE